jgi:hypothetical protein
VEDSANKAGHGLCDDLSFLYCFTGIACVETNQPTSVWLLEALAEATAAGHGIWDIVERFAANASSLFQSSRFLSRLTARDRRLTVMLTGFTRDGHIANFLISNFQDFTNFVDHEQAQPEFTVRAERSIERLEKNPTLMQAIGQFSALRNEDVLPLRQMLEERRSPESIRQAAISLVQSIADRPSSGGTVGKKLNTARLSSQDPFVPVAGYSSDEAENVLHLLDAVDLRTGSPLLQLANVEMATDEPIVFPRTHRNAPCPCGSGRAFRNCHRIRRRRSIASR